MKKSLFILNERTFSDVYSPSLTARIAAHSDLNPRRLDRETWFAHRHLIEETDYIFSSWGMPVMDDQFLSAARRLKHVFYAAGSIRSFYTEAAQASGITVSSAWRANAIPVAEFTHAAIILSLKKFWRFSRNAHASRSWHRTIKIPGTFESTVGLISLGAIGQAVAQRLHGHDIRIIVYDPFADPEQARALDIELVDLDTLVRTADIVSLHAPDLPSTRGLLKGTHFRAMKTGATFINTARGLIVDEDAMIEVLMERPDLDAVLDVTATEPDNRDSLLWTLPNVTLTPHIAGSLQQECRRMGTYMVEEFERYTTGIPLQHQVTPAIFSTMA